MSTDMIRLALECGAAKAVMLDRAQLITLPIFRDICKGNGCGKYGRCWICPPEIGEIGTLIASLDAYDRVLWYQTISPLEDSFDIEGMFEAGHAHAQLSQRISEALKAQGYTGFLHLSCGGCHLCETCTKPQGLPCRHPDRALPSLEGYGIDVYNTTKDTSLSYINGQNTVTYFGAVLFREA